MSSETNGVACPLCGSLKSDVVETQEKVDFIRRKRVCLICDNRFVTIETICENPKRLKKHRGGRPRKRSNA